MKQQDISLVEVRYEAPHCESFSVLAGGALLNVSGNVNWADETGIPSGPDILEDIEESF